MSVKLVGGGVHRIWTYRAQGVAPAGLPPDEAFLERVVRSAVSWNDTILSWIRGTEVTEEQLTDGQVESMMAAFRDRLKGH